MEILESIQVVHFYIHNSSLRLRKACRNSPARLILHCFRSAAIYYMPPFPDFLLLQVQRFKKLSDILHAKPFPVAAGAVGEALLHLLSA